MIAKILQIILSIINFIIMLIIRLILSVFPSMGLEQLYNVFETFFDIMGGAVNFTHFILGDTAFIFIDIVIILFTLKHIVLPVINFVRKCIT